MTDPGPRIWDFEELPPGCLEGTELERITKDLYPLLASFGSQGLSEIPEFLLFSSTFSWPN